MILFKKARTLGNHDARPALWWLKVLPKGGKIYLRIAEDRGWACARASKDGPELLKIVDGEIVEDK